MIIDSDEILPTTNLSRLVYTNEKDKEESVALAEGLIIYYNGHKVGSVNMDEALLKPERGNVILCDKEANGVYDAAIVTNYRTLIVNYINDEFVYDMYNQHMSIGSGIDVIMTRNGEDIDAQELQKGDVLTVAESLDGTRVTIKADYSEAVGYIAQVTNESVNRNVYKFVTSDNETLELCASESYLNAIRNGLALNLLKPDSRLLSVKLNAFGEIADVQLAEEGAVTYHDNHYGYLVDANCDGTLSTKVQLKILTENNKLEIFTLADRVTFGSYFVNSYLQRSLSPSSVLSSLGGEGNIIPQLVQYRSDENKKIIQLYLADAAGNADVISEDVSQSFLNYRQGVLGQKYFVDNKTVVFSIP